MDTAKNQYDWFIDDGEKVYIVDQLFDGIYRNAIDSNAVIDKPHSEDGYTIACLNIYTLTDGTEVELCFWWTDGMTFWDLSIDKAKFDANIGTDFLSYLTNLNVHLYSVLDRYACKWKYCGIIQDDEAYRIQYYLENEGD